MYFTKLPSINIPLNIFANELCLINGSVLLKQCGMWILYSSLQVPGILIPVCVIRIYDSSDYLQENLPYEASCLYTGYRVLQSTFTHTYLEGCSIKFNRTYSQVSVCRISVLAQFYQKFKFKMAALSISQIMHVI